MSEAVMLGLLTVVAGPIVAYVIWFMKTTYGDNRDSWKLRAESAEGREQELKTELLPAVRDLSSGLNTLAEGHAQDRETVQKLIPVLERVEEALDKAYPSNVWDIRDFREGGDGHS